MFTPFQITVVRNLAKVESKSYNTVEIAMIMRDLYPTLRDVTAIRLEQTIAKVIYSNETES